VAPAPWSRTSLITFELWRPCSAVIGRARFDETGRKHARRHGVPGIHRPSRSSKPAVGKFSDPAAHTGPGAVSHQHIPCRPHLRSARQFDDRWQHLSRGRLSRRHLGSVVSENQLAAFFQDSSSARCPALLQQRQGVNPGYDPWNSRDVRCPHHAKILSRRRNHGEYIAPQQSASFSSIHSVSRDRYGKCGRPGIAIGFQAGDHQAG